MEEDYKERIKSAIERADLKRLRYIYNFIKGLGLA